MSCVVLGIPITTVASDSAFSTGVLTSINVLCLMKQFKLLYAHLIGCLVLLVSLTFFLLRIYNEAFPLYNYLLTYANFN